MTRVQEITLNYWQDIYSLQIDVSMKLNNISKFSVRDPVAEQLYLESKSSLGRITDRIDELKRES
jgi:hypothetical protein